MRSFREHKCPNCFHKFEILTDGARYEIKTQKGWKKGFIKAKCPVCDQNILFCEEDFYGVSAKDISREDLRLNKTSVSA